MEKKEDIPEDEMEKGLFGVAMFIACLAFCLIAWIGLLVIAELVAKVVIK